MSKERFIRYAVLVESGLAIVALILGRLLGLHLEESLRFDGDAWILGFLGTLPMLAFYFVLKSIPLKGLKEVDRIVRLFFQQYMKNLSIMSIAIISALAGLGEELLFRGLFQRGIQEYLIYFGIDGYGLLESLVVILVVSILFGLAHAVTKTYFFLAFLISIYLGILFWLSDNLAVPAIIHAFYDFFVFLHLKYGDSEQL